MPDVKPQNVQDRIPAAFWVLVKIASGLAFMHFANKIIVKEGYAAMVPPHAASLCIAVCTTNDPKKMGLGYLSAGAAAYGVLQAVGDGFMPDFGGSRALVVAAAVAAMILTDSMHPPAAAYAMTLVDAAPMKALGPKFILYPGFLGVCIVYVAALIGNNVHSLLTTGKVKLD
eukprot:CAMPEP_0196717100 /NCGR_PEP_ID=MMETSP1091-20130531/507_1 /TAXON_ID=302021 /ORGANISM="Rhodomonas sp., Strain CCMP768" /LENGTH=171 /DNA_ID=CAMNT_0042057325 /DNA_START=21 /DNA_END=536 /DNA_ORIENTATION=-